MKSFHFLKPIGLGMLLLSIAVLPLTIPASAQNAPANRTTTTAPREIDSNWGWLGLLGLIGLAGLAGRKREEPTRYRDPNVTTETEYRQ